MIGDYRFFRKKQGIYWKIFEAEEDKKNCPPLVR